MDVDPVLTIIGLAFLVVAGWLFLALFVGLCLGPLLRRNRKQLTKPSIEP